MWELVPLPGDSLSSGLVFEVPCKTSPAEAGRDLWRCSAPAPQLRAGSPEVGVEYFQGQRLSSLSGQPQCLSTLTGKSFSWCSVQCSLFQLMPRVPGSRRSWGRARGSLSTGRDTLDPSHFGFVINHVPIKLPRQHILEGHPE